MSEFNNRKRKRYKIRKDRIWILVLIFCTFIYGLYSIYQGTGKLSPNYEDIVANNTFLSGITVDGVDISGLKYEEAKNKLIPIAAKKLDEFSLTVDFENKKYNVNNDDIKLDTNLTGVLDNAIMLGQSGSRGARKKALKSLKKDGKQYTIGYTYDAALVDEQLNRVATESGLGAKEATVKMENGALTYVEGKEGLTVKKSEFRTALNKAIADGEKKITIVAETEMEKPITTVQTLKDNLVKKASTTTDFSTSTKSRINNVVKAANMLNGQVIMPGKTLSVNTVLGARTLENGWSIATGIANGRYIDDVGGGVCQVSSTLYNSAIKSGLAISQRSHHTYPVSYLPKGQDAAISTGGPDLKIKNNYDFPVYIVTEASASSKKVTITIYGPQSPDGTVIDFKSKVLSDEPLTEKAKITESTNLLPGEYVEMTPRKNRIEVERWLEYTKDGKQVKTEKLQNDVYNGNAGVYVIGKGTPIDETTGVPKGKKVDEKYLKETRATTTTVAPTTTNTTTNTTTKTTTKTTATTATTTATTVVN